MPISGKPLSPAAGSRWISGRILPALVLSVLAVSAAFALPKGEAGAKGASGAVARGQFLVQIAGCNDCHTPWKMGEKGPEPDMSRMLSGHPQDLAMPPAPQLAMPWAWAGSATMTAFAGPWGISYAANLTPDRETGIGGWDADLFVQTLRTGKVHTGTRAIMPPMPWPTLARQSDEDLRAIFAYLMSIPPISNRVPAFVAAGGGR